MEPSAQRSTRRFTVDEVLRMVDAGILAEDEPVELLDVVDSVFETRKFLINCNYAVPEAKAELARSVCKSLRVY